MEVAYEKWLVICIQKLWAKGYTAFQKGTAPVRGYGLWWFDHADPAAFDQNPDVLTYYQQRYQYVHVDEYQDTNHAQYQLVKLLASRFKNIYVVGDADQSIYGWRGEPTCRIS